MRQPDKVDSWYWAEADLKLLLQQFRGLKVTQQYKLTQKQLTALGPEGKAPLARVEMEMLGKVVNDFLAQLGPQLSGSSAAAEAAAGMSQPGNDTSSSYSGLAEDVSGMTGVSLGSTDAVLGTRGEHLGSQVGQQQDPRGAVRVGPGKSLTNSQVKKKDGLQKQREQLRVGETKQHWSLFTTNVLLHHKCINNHGRTLSLECAEHLSVSAHQCFHVLRFSAVFWPAMGSAYCTCKGNVQLHLDGASGLLLDPVLTRCTRSVK